MLVPTLRKKKKKWACDVMYTCATQAALFMTSHAQNAIYKMEAFTACFIVVVVVFAPSKRQPLSKQPTETLLLSLSPPPPFLPIRPLTLIALGPL